MKTHLLPLRTCLVGPYDAKALNRELYIDSRVKSTNREIYYSADLLHTATNEGKKVTFNYQAYTPDKEKALHNRSITTRLPEATQV